MGMYDSFQTDNEAENKGVILDYGDFRVRIAHAGQGNSRYVKQAEIAFKPVRRQIEAGVLSNERSVDILIDIFAKAIVLDWQVLKDEKWVSGIEGPTGELLPFNEENVKQTFKNLPILFNDIREQASQISLFLKSSLEAEAKN